MLIRSDVTHKSQLEFDMVFDPDERIGETEPSRKKVKVEVGDEVNIKYVDPHSFRPNVLRGVVKEIIPDMGGKDPKRSKIIRLDCSKEFDNKLIDIFTDHIIDIINISNRENKYNSEKELKRKNTILIMDKIITYESKLNKGDTITYNNYKYIYGITAFDDFHLAVKYYKLDEPADEFWKGINIIFTEGSHYYDSKITTCKKEPATAIIKKPFVNIKGCKSDKSILLFGLYLDNTNNINISDISISSTNRSGITIDNESLYIVIDNCVINGMQYSIHGCINTENVYIINSVIKKQIYFHNIHNLIIENCSISDYMHPLLVVKNQARCIELENNCLFLNGYMFRDCIKINKLSGTFKLNNNKIYGAVDNVVKISKVYDNSNSEDKYSFNITNNDICCNKFIIYYEGIKSEDKLEDLEDDNITKYYKIISTLNKITKSKNIENPLFGPYRYEKLEIVDSYNLSYGDPISTDKEDNNPIEPDDNKEENDPLNRTSDLPVVKKFGDDTFIFANGTEITIKDRSDGKEGASIVYNTKDGSEETIDVPKNTHVFGGRHNDDTLTNTRIIIEGGVIKEVFGGGLHKSHTSVANILLYGGKVSTLFGAGSNGCTNACNCENVKYTLENVKDSHNITDHSIINIFGGTVSGLLFGGGQDMTYTKSSDMYIGGTDNSNINYITVGGSNGYVSSAKLEVYSNTTNIGTIQGINRGIIDSISIDIKCCKEIKKLFCGGETPFIGSKDNPNSSSDSSGKFKTCLVTINKVHSNIGEFALGGNDYEVITEENNDCVTVVVI